MIDWERRPAELTVDLENEGRSAADQLEEIAKGLTHESKLVREGAIYGIHIALNRLQSIMTEVNSLLPEETSPAITICLKALIEEYEQG